MIEQHIGCCLRTQFFWIGFIICFINNFVLELLKEPIKSDNNDGGNHNNQVNQEM